MFKHTHIKAKAVYDIVYHSTDSNGYVRIEDLINNMERYEHGCRLLGDNMVSINHYKSHTSLKKRLILLKNSMFDPSKEYYNLTKKIDNLFSQWDYIRLNEGISKSHICRLMETNRPTLDSYIDEMTKYGHKPYFNANSYNKNSSKKIDTASLVAFLIKKSEIQNGVDSVKQFYEKIDSTESNWSNEGDISVFSNL